MFMRRVKGILPLGRALAYVIVVRSMLTLKRTNTLRKLISGLGSLKREPALDVAGKLALISWSVSATSRLVPGATCLTQAYAGAWLLARMGIESEVKITLPADPSEGFKPHAWLMHQNTIVLGGTPQQLHRHTEFRKRTIAS